MIEPLDINTNNHFWDAFGNYEKEISANWIVKFCQHKGDFAPFTYERLNEWAKENGHEGNITLNGLDTLNGVEQEDKLIILMPRFIAACWGASPNLTK